ncbi:MAG: potassium-transporting ATPase subunit C [Sphingobacteriales bacterium]|nr:MAG: potassium-transporting ATPase subunit C [Sphingobacteriales bacterium]
MKSQLSPALRLTLVLMVLCIGLYSLAVLGMAQAAPFHGTGIRLADAKGHSYYEAIGQKFDSVIYFQSRPSAVGYNAAGSGGSNKGPNNPDYLNEVQERVTVFRAQNPGAPVPMDLVTASGSGLDPDISIAAAQAQVVRIAQARSVPEASIQQLIQNQQHTPFFGPQTINVLRLNLALDTLH